MTYWESILIKRAEYNFASESFIKEFTKTAEELGCSFDQIKQSLDELEQGFQKNPTKQD